MRKNLYCCTWINTLITHLNFWQHLCRILFFLLFPKQSFHLKAAFLYMKLINIACMYRVYNCCLCQYVAITYAISCTSSVISVVCLCCKRCSYALICLCSKFLPVYITERQYVWTFVCCCGSTKGLIWHK